MVFARKRFGQHFLHDRGVLDRIVAARSRRSPTRPCVEIGPGRGALTERLLGTARTLDAIEIDRDLAALLRERWGSVAGISSCTRATRWSSTSPRLRDRRGAATARHRQPALQHLHAAAVPRGGRARAHRRPARDAAEGSHRPHRRAAPGSADYGRLTVMLAPWFEAKHLFDVGPGAFTPAPRVWSAVARLTRPARTGVRAAARRSRARYRPRSHSGARRCAMRCAAWSDVEAIVAAGVDPGARPETLSPAEFARIAAQVPRSPCTR